MSIITPYDDTNPNIVYSGTWFTGGSVHEFDDSTHGTNEDGATATFPFTGTSIAVFGTISKLPTVTRAATSSYSVDGSSPITFTATLTDSIQYNQQFFNTSGLQEGEHTLVITCTNTNAYFWLDYLQVGDNPADSVASSSVAPTFADSSAAISISPSTSPSPSTTSLSPDSLGTQSTLTVTSYVGGTTNVASATVFTTIISSPSSSGDIGFIVDDSDASVTYNGVWFIADASEDHDGTSHGTEAEGATATLQFTGTGVAVYGIIPQTASGQITRGSTYAIDGGSPVSFSPPSADTTLYQQLFYQSPVLQAGDHTLVVTSGTGDLSFYLDYFETNLTSLVAGTNTITLPAGSASTFFAPGASSSSGAQVSSAKSGSHAGAIAGGVIGALFIIALAIIAFFLYRRRRAMRAPSRRAPATPDPTWISEQWAPEKLTTRQTQYTALSA